MAHRQDHDLSPPSRHRQFENRELHILRDAAGLIRIPLWKILRLAEPCHAPIPSRSPPGRSDGIEPRRSWTDDELICLNAAANIIPVGLVRLLVLGELGDPDVPEDGQGRNGVSDIGYGGSPGGVIEMNDQHVSPEGHGTAEEYPGTVYQYESTGTVCTPSRSSAPVSVDYQNAGHIVPEHSSPPRLPYGPDSDGQFPEPTLPTPLSDLATLIGGSNESGPASFDIQQPSETGDLFADNISFGTPTQGQHWSPGVWLDPSSVVQVGVLPEQQGPVQYRYQPNHSSPLSASASSASPSTGPSGGTPEGHNPLPGDSVNATLFPLHSTSPRQRVKARRHGSTSGVKKGKRATVHMKPDELLKRINTPKCYAEKCVRCHLSHKRCLPSDKSGECERCSKKNYSMSNLPCLYFSLSDITLFRTMTDPISKKPYGSLSLHENIDGIMQQAYGTSHSVELSITLSQGLETTIPLKVTKFDNESIQNSVSGDLKGLFCHPFALSDLDEATKSLHEFVRHSVCQYIDAKINRDDELTLSVFGAACKRIYRDLGDNHFLRDTLYLWTAARTIEGGWILFGPEALGLPPNREGAATLTSAAFIDYQFSALMVERVLLPLRSRVLRKLEELTLSKTSENWFVIFLATFILLHTYGLLVAQQRQFARMRNAKVRYTSMHLIQSLHIGAKTLLSHFHLICKGQKPFELDWSLAGAGKPVQRMARVSSEEAAFLDTLSHIVRKKVSHFSELMLTDHYEENHWFTGQLFVPGWAPPKTLVESPLADMAMYKF